MECDPTLNVVVVKLAVLLVKGIGPVIAVPLSRNVTVPLAAAGLTVAVNLNDVPALKASSPTESSSSTSVLSLVTFWIRGADVAGLKFVSPLY